MAVVDEIKEMEARLVNAELGPDPAFFEAALADDALLDGQFAKAKVVEAHRPGQGLKFTRVEMSDMRILDHGTAAVVTCNGTYEGPKGTVSLRFLRVWVRKAKGWQIVAGTTAIV